MIPTRSCRITIIFHILFPKPSRGPSSYKVKALDTRVYPTVGEDALKTVASSPTIQDKKDLITTAAVKNEGEYTIMDNGDDSSYEKTDTGTMEAEIKPKKVVAAAEQPTVQTQGLGDAPLTSPLVSPSSGPQGTHPVVQPGENGPGNVTRISSYLFYMVRMLDFC